jgi:HSP20 family molecular chaperone IbpA
MFSVNLKNFHLINYLKGVKRKEMENSSLQQLIGNTLHNLQHEGELDFRQTINSFMNTSLETSWKPPYDMINGDRFISIFIELAGVEQGNIHIDFKNNKMTVKGERKRFSEEESFVREIIYGIFERRISLPISVTKKENVEASFINGILRITIDKEKEGEHNFSVNL